MAQMAGVSKAVILAGGLGTRLMPATKAVPKEMIPIVDKPLIQYAVEEAVAAGITDVVFVVADGKESIAEHFGHTSRAEAFARESGDRELLEVLEAPTRLARYEYVLQDQPKGIAHAVACARPFVEGEPFALIFPDDLILGQTSCVAQLVEAYGRCQGSVIAVEEVEESQVPEYGIVDPAGPGNPARLRGIVEKPTLADAPSRLGVVGRYIIHPTIFGHIERLKPGKNGELQLTDALAMQIDAGEHVCAFQYEGTRYDTGRPLGLLVASIGAALCRDDMRQPLLEKLTAMLEGAPS